MQAAQTDVVRCRGSGGLMQVGEAFVLGHCGSCRLVETV